MMESGTSVASTSSAEERLMDQLLLRASDWTLACDNALLNKLQELSDNLVRSSSKIASECDQLMSNVDELQFKVTNVTNEFLLLSNTHFVENKIEEFQECELKSKPQDQPIDIPTKAEKEAMLLDKMKEAIQVGIRTQQHHEKLRLQRSEEFCHKSVDVHPALNIGHIIGSSKFFSSKYCGLEAEMAQRLTKTTNSCVSSETSNSTSSTLEDSLPPVRGTPQSAYPTFGYVDNQIQNVSTPTPSFYENTRIVDEGSLFATPKASRAASENLQDDDSNRVVPPSIPVLPKSSVPGQFSYIPVPPARPPSTPSASSESDDDSPPDLASHFTSNHTAHEDLFTEVVSVPPVQESVSDTKLLAESSSRPQQIAEENVISSDPAPDINRTEQELIKSPTSKPVYKFMDAAVISQLQSKLLSAGTLKPSIVKQPEESRQTEDSVQRIPQKKLVQSPEVVSASAVQQNKDKRATEEPDRSNMPKIPAVKESSAEISDISSSYKVAPTKDIEISASYESPADTTSKKDQAGLENVSKLRTHSASVKKSIFDDSDSDDDDDLLFSSKPLKSIMKPKTSIFADLDETLKKNDDLFRPTSGLDLRDPGDNKSSHKAYVVPHKLDPPITIQATDTTQIDRKGKVEDEQNQAKLEQSEKHSPNVQEQLTDNVSKLLQSQVHTDRHNEKGPTSIAVSNRTDKDLNTTNEAANASVTAAAHQKKMPSDLVSETSSSTASEIKTATTANQGLSDIEGMPNVNEAKSLPVFTFPKGVHRAPSSSSESSEGGEDIFERGIESEVLSAGAKAQLTANLDQPTPSSHADSVQPRSPSEHVVSTTSVPGIGSTNQKAASLFEDDPDDDDIFKDSSLALPKSYVPIRSSSPPPMPAPKKSSEYSAKTKTPLVGKSIFDSSDSDDDLFSTKKSVKTSKDSKPVTALSTNLKTGLPAKNDNIADSVSSIPILQPSPLPSTSPAIPTNTSVFASSETKSILTSSGNATESFKVSAEQRPGISTPSIKKEKSIFDSSDSDDDLFSTKTFKKSPSVTKSKPGPENKPAVTKPTIPKQKTSIFDDDSSDDSDDLFGKSKAKVTKATSQSSIATSNKQKVDQPPPDFKTLVQEETNEIADIPTQPRKTRNIASAAPFAGVVNDLESLFKSKLASKRPDETESDVADKTFPDANSDSSLQSFAGQDSSPVSSPRLENNLLSTIGSGEATLSPDAITPTASVTFDESPDLANVLPCITKNRAKPTQRRRPASRTTITRYHDASQDSA